MQIDRIWLCSNLSYKNVSVLLHKLGVNDHRVMLVDTNMKDLIDTEVALYKTFMRRLKCKNMIALTFFKL